MSLRPRAIAYDLRIATLLRSKTGKVHLAGTDGAPRCQVRANELVPLEGDTGDVTCGLCERLAVKDPTGELGEVTESTAEATDVSPSPFEAPSAADRRAEPAEALTAPVTERVTDPVATAKRLAFPVSFAALGGVAVIWMLRRRNR